MRNSEIYIGDSRDILTMLDETLHEKVALLVTSPPYYIGRGYEDYIEGWMDYWQMIEDVFTLSDELIEPWGKTAINFADKYANFKEFRRSLEICYTPHYTRIMAPNDLWARIIWDKVRVAVDGAKHITNDRLRFTGNMRVAPNWEYIFVWRKRGEGKQIKKNIDMTYDEWKEWVNGIWRFSSVPKNARVASSKLAVFPEELPRRLIKMYCVPTDHLALTKDGWKGPGDLHVKEDILTYNIETHTLEWQPLIDIATFPYAGELMKIENSFVKYLFTPNHRWPIENKSGQFKIKRGYQLNSSDRIIIAGNHNFAEDTILNSRDAAILGWLVTDGHVHWHTENGPQGVIIQSKKKYHNEVRDLLGDELSSESYNLVNDCYTFRIKASCLHRIFDATNYRTKEDFPKVVTRLNREAAESMYGAMMLADGHLEKGYEIFYQNHGPVLDGFQILVILLGRTGNICQSGMYIKNTNHVKTYRAIGTERFTGEVWCPITPNKTWVMRSANGNPAITGNTQPGDIVLDPFAGTGTTIKVARELGRIGIGIEKNPDMLDILQSNLQSDMFIDNEVVFHV